MKKLTLSLLLLFQLTIVFGHSNLKEANNFMQNVPWGFEENKGQITGEDSKKVKYFFKEGNLTMFLMENGIAYQFNHVIYPKDYKPLSKFDSREEIEKKQKLQKQIRTETYRMDVSLVGANKNVTVKEEGKSEDYINYYNHDALDVHSYKKVTYYNVYPNIDWVVYIQEAANAESPKVKYDFDVHPGGDPSQIKLKTNWVEDLKLNEDGSLTLSNRMGSITEKKPESFQDDEKVSTNFNLSEDIVQFELANYNNKKELIIDPGIEWGMLYGGSNEDFGRYCTIDSGGNIYLAGETNSASGIASGGYQNTLIGSGSTFLVKFNSQGTRLWGTYYGNFVSGWDSWPCLALGSGCIYLSHYTDVATSNIASGGHQNVFGGGIDAYLVKFNLAGTRLWATYYGGALLDYGNSCTTDSFGNVYLAGTTNSTYGIAFGGFQNTHVGGDATDAFVVKFNSSGVRQWATYYGENTYDFCYSIQADKWGNTFICGYTEGFSTMASAGHQNTYGGGAQDAFLVKFNNLGNREWATFYGGAGRDYGKFCNIDHSGNVYLCGFTNSTTNIAFSGHQNLFAGGYWDGFLAKFNNQGVRQWATYYGGDTSDYCYANSIDHSGNVFVTGITESDTGIAYKGYQNFKSLYQDGFLVKFDSTGKRKWGTYVGDSTMEWTVNCHADNSGNVFVTGHTPFNFHINNKTLKPIGQSDVLLIKYIECIPINNVIKINFCDSFYWSPKKKWYKTSNFNDTLWLRNQYGCDSVVTINLTLNYTSNTNFIVNTCDSFFWAAKSKWYKSSNFNDTIKLTNSNGCDSIVALKLTINNASYTVIKDSACGAFYWAAKNKSYTNSTIDTIKLINHNGCDSIVTLVLKILNSNTVFNKTACDTFYWPEKSKGYNVSNSVDTIKLKNQAGCDSVINLNLTILKSPRPSVVSNGNKLSTQSYLSYQWKKNGSDINGATNQNYTVTSNGDYAVAVKDANTCKGISSSININIVSIQSIDGINFEIYPNPSKGIVNLKTSNLSLWKLFLIDTKGSVINQSSFNQNIQIDLSNYPVGNYMIQLINEKGETAVYKITKE